jgi:hypothetical protein
MRWTIVRGSIDSIFSRYAKYLKKPGGKSTLSDETLYVTRLAPLTRMQVLLAFQPLPSHRNSQQHLHSTINRASRHGYSYAKHDMEIDDTATRWGFRLLFIPHFGMRQRHRIIGDKECSLQPSQIARLLRLCKFTHAKYVQFCSPSLLSPHFSVTFFP